MVDHLTWRRRVGEHVCRSYAHSSKVAATALGGSVARGWADEYSDVEVFVFWDEAPAPADRVSAVDRSGGSIDVFWADDDAEMRWLSAMQKSQGRVGQLWPFESNEWSEHYYIDDLNIGVSGFLVTTVEEWVADLTQDTPNDLAEMVAATLLADAPMTGKQLLSGWASELKPYPEPLALAVIERWLEPDARWWSIDQLAARDDRPAFDAVLVAMQQRLVRLLLAANGRYLLDPRPKWTRKLIAECEHKPADCNNRLGIVQASRPVEAALLLQDLFEETLEIISELFPVIEVETARWLYRLRRGVLSDRNAETQ